MRFITDYRRLNQKLVIQMYTLPKIGETRQHLERFQYETALILNMGYYTIRILSASQEMMTIFTKFEKFRYNHLPMGMCASGDILQARVGDILGDIEGVKNYIDGILVLRKDFFTRLIEQLRIILSILRATGLQVNTSKCSFGLKDIPYLGYLITREGIKSNLNKVQGIMDLGRPTTTTEASAHRYGAVLFGFSISR